MHEYPAVIALGGGHGSGKTEIAWFLAKNYDYHFASSRLGIQDLTEQGHRVVVDDIRDLSDLNMVHNFTGAVSWYVRRPEFPVNEGLAMCFSEMVSNNGTIEQLLTLVSYMMEGR